MYAEFEFKMMIIGNVYVCVFMDVCVRVGGCIYAVPGKNIRGNNVRGKNVRGKNFRGKKSPYNWVLLKARF